MSCVDTSGIVGARRCADLFRTVLVAAHCTGAQFLVSRRWDAEALQLVHSRTAASDQHDLRVMVELLHRRWPRMVLYVPQDQQQVSHHFD